MVTPRLCRKAHAGVCPRARMNTVTRISSARKWRMRFVAHRLAGLLDEPRPGRPRTVSDEQVEAVITRTLETTPADAMHWSTRSLARELGMSQSAVSRIWRAFGLAPHKQDFWTSADPLFVEKVRDIVGLYLNPPERALVLCVDDKTQIQPLNRKRLPVKVADDRLTVLPHTDHFAATLLSEWGIGRGRPPPGAVLYSV